MKPYPQPILIRLSDVSDTGTSTAHRSTYVTTTLPAIVQGLRNLECQNTPFTEFQGPDALFSRLLAALAGTTEYDAMLGNEVERLNALLAEQVEKVETLRRERDEARRSLNCILEDIEDDDNGDGMNSQGITLWKIRTARTTPTPGAQP